MYYKPFFIPIIVSDITLTLIFLVLKFKKTTLSSKIVPHNAKPGCKSFRNLSEVKSSHDSICLFANYIYDLTPMKLFHPIGHKII